jgi:thiol-disulfide isomerase/thioredoxin
MSWLLMVMVGTIVAFTLFSQNIEETKPQESLGADFLPQTLLDPSERKVSSSILKDKYVGLYFSASWCGPCRSFTPELIKFRNQHQDNFEVVLIGGDGSPKAQSKYIKKYEMPWLAMENQSDAAKTASEKLKVQYIPYLVILDPERNVVSKDGVSEIRAKGNDALKSWIQ